MAQPGIGAFPVTVNTSGAVGITIRAMTFSRFEVRTMLGFDFIALELDGRGLTYPSNNQVIQHNHFVLGQFANNGVGLQLHSLDAATSSVQGNRFDIQNIYQNAFNIVDGDATYKASSSNTYYINAMDNETSVGIESFSPYNKFYVGFTGSPSTSLRLNSGSDFNRFEFANNFSTDITVNQNGGGAHNTVICQPPSILPQTGVTVTNDVDQNNDFGCSIMVVAPISAAGRATCT